MDEHPDFGSHACLFSFSKNKYGNALNGFVDPRLGWAELKLVDGRFFTGFTGESLGVLVALGNRPLEMITPESDGVTGLTNIPPPADFIEASILSRRNRAGFQMDRFNYGSSLPVAASMTYVLRSTSNKRADHPRRVSCLANGNGWGGVDGHSLAEVEELSKTRLEEII